MNQSEFAKLAAVGTSTVSRRMNGSVPEGVLLERIADILVLDKDIVATRAGYQPKELLEIDPDLPEVPLLPYIRAITWDDYTLESIRRQLEWLAEVQRGEHDR